jgi:hypothetical protein
MSRYLVTMQSNADRARAMQIVTAAPAGSRVEVKGPRRSLPQNDRMWAMLTDISRQLPWHGKKLTPDCWKLLFLDALKREVQPVPNIDGTGFVNINTSSSDLTKEEMTGMIDLMFEFGGRHGVVFHDKAEAA